MSDRVESASQKAVPDPKGKGLVMVILAVAVLGALVWEFSGQGAASKATRDAVERERQQQALEDGKGPPQAQPDPAERPSEHPGRTQAAPTAPRSTSMIEVRIGESTATLPPALALAAWLESAPTAREELRLQILEALVPLAKAGGHDAREAFEAATWLIEGAGESTSEVILHLTNATTSALDDDAATLGAILFLSRVPDGVDKRTGLSLDGVITDSTRPLQIRLAAARIRPADGRSQRVRDLAEDATTHPALRDALK